MGIFDSIKRKLGYDIINYNGVNEIFGFRKMLWEKYYKKNGVYHGKYLRFFCGGDDDHWVDKEINYKNGVKEGICRYYWKKHISAEGNFSNGKATGIIKKYFRYEDELKDLKLHPVVQKYADLDKGIFKVFNLEGKLLEESEIDDVEFNEGSTGGGGCWGGIYPKKNGLCRKWFENGKMLEKGYWEKNNTSSIYNLCHRKGEHIQYHENGKIFKIGEWDDKQPVGIHKFYYPSGKVEFEVEYAKPTKNPFISHHFAEKEKIISEKWYNEEGSLMSANEIIAKAGIDPRSKPKDPKVIHRSWAHGILDQENFIVINNMNFKRMGEIKFYGLYFEKLPYTMSFRLGHSYSILKKGTGKKAKS